MNAYMIFSFDVADQEGFAPYGKAVMPTIIKHGGEVLTADFKAESLEGNGHGANVILQFPSVENAKEFFNDPEYAPFKKLRMDTTVNSTIVLTTAFQKR